MRKIGYCVIILIFSFCWSCQEKNQHIQEQIKYYSNGNIRVKRIFNSKTNIGTKFIYYPDGQLRNEIPYFYTRKHGTAKFYYTSGQLYSATEYVDGLKNGKLIRYRENGKIMSIQSYKDDLPANDLIEYNKDGSKKSFRQIMFEKITPVKNYDVGYQFFMPDKSKNTEFFFGSLKDEKYMTDELIPLINHEYTLDNGNKLMTQVEDGIGKIYLDLRNANHLSEKFTIVAKKETFLFNPYVTSTELVIQLQL